MSDYSKAALGQLLSCMILLFALPSYIYDVYAGSPEPGRAWITLLLFGFTSAGVYAFFLSNQFKTWISERINWDKIFLVFVSLYGFFFAALSCHLYNQFEIGLHDTGDFLQGLWSATQGKFFTVIASHESHPSLFAWHTKLTLFFLVPIYKILPDPRVIYILNSLTIACSAIPLYLLSKKDIGKLPAFLLCFSFLTAPYLIGMHVEELLFETFGIPFVFLAFYYFEKGKFLPFFIYFLLALTPKEELGLCVAMFGIYALIRKRSARWIWTPLLIGIGWSLLTILVIQPYLRGDHWEITTSYGVFGGTLSEILKNIILNPILVLKTVFTIKKLQYFWIILSSMGFVFPFFTAAGLFAIPLILKVALLGAYFLPSGIVHSEVRTWYAAPIIVFGYIGIVYTLKKILRRQNGPWIKELICVLLFIQMIVNINSYAYWTHLAKKDQTADFPHSYLVTLKKITRTIPDNASVIIPYYLYAHFHRRDNVYCAEASHAKRYVQQGVDYVVLDERRELKRQPLEEVTAVKHDPRYQMVLQDRAISLYQYQGK